VEGGVAAEVGPTNLDLDSYLDLDSDSDSDLVPDLVADAVPFLDAIGVWRLQIGRDPGLQAQPF